MRIFAPGTRGLKTAGLVVCSLLLFMSAGGSVLPAAQTAPGPAILGATDLSRLLKERGATVLNTMSRLECMDSRIPGSLCPTAGDPAAQLPRLAPDRNRPLVFYCEDAGCPQNGPYVEAARSLGYTKVSFLKGGFAAWKEAGYAAESPERIPREPSPAVRAATLKRWLEEGRPLLVLDIRAAGLYREGHIQGAINIPLEELPERYQEIPLGKPLLVVDGRGDRSFLAASYLDRKELRAMRLFGGMGAWQALLEGEAKSRSRR